MLGRYLRADELPARPDPGTGFPRPPHAPGWVRVRRSRSSDRDRKPSPPPGQGPVVAWYTGNSSPSPRGSETARVDPSITVQYGTQANEQAIRQQIEGVAVFAAVSVSPTGPNSAAQISALSSRISTNLTAKPGQQSVSDIQTDYAAAQSIMKDAAARQTQSTTQLQNVIDQTETVSTQEVASQLLALQNSLSASYEATSMLAGLTLTKFLPAGG